MGEAEETLLISAEVYRVQDANGVWKAGCRVSVDDDNLPAVNAVDYTKKMIATLELFAKDLRDGSLNEENWAVIPYKEK